MRRVFVGSVLVSASLFLPCAALADYQAPAGYNSELLTGLPSGFSGLAVNSTGELAVTDGSTVTLYNTWQNGRTEIGTITDASWTSDTDPVFLNSTTVLFGENGSSDALWEVNFATATPTVTQVTLNGSLPHIAGVALTGSTTALVSGSSATGFATGDLYLDSVDLTKTSGNVSSVVSGVGDQYEGDPGVTPGGNLVLLESKFNGEDSLVHLYNSDGASAEPDVDLSGGNGYGAYGIAFDSSGAAYVTTGDTITRISDLDAASPTVTQFGGDPTFNAFFTSISYTGGSFAAGNPSNTGTLIIADGSGSGDVFAVFVPEPATAALLLVSAFGLLSRRRRAGGGR